MKLSLPLCSLPYRLGQWNDFLRARLSLHVSRTQLTPGAYTCDDVYCSSSHHLLYNLQVGLIFPVYNGLKPPTFGLDQEGTTDQDSLPSRLLVLMAFVTDPHIINGDLPLIHFLVMAICHKSTFIDGNFALIRRVYFAISVYTSRISGVLSANGELILINGEFPHRD